LLSLRLHALLGRGTTWWVVRYDRLKVADNKSVLPGGTKDGLKTLPAIPIL